MLASGLLHRMDARSGAPPSVANTTPGFGPPSSLPRWRGQQGMGVPPDGTRRPSWGRRVQGARGCWISPRCGRCWQETGDAPAANLAPFGELAAVGRDLGDTAEGLLAAAGLQAGRVGAENPPIYVQAAGGWRGARQIAHLGSRAWRLGYRRLHILLARDGVKLNHERLCRRHWAGAGSASGRSGAAPGPCRRRSGSATGCLLRRSALRRVRLPSRAGRG